MKLIEALKILHQPPPEDAEPFTVSLLCGCSPLLLGTFLGAHLQRSLPARHVVVRPGTYGDLLGSLERLPRDPPHAAVVILEWQDLDPRLGLRGLGGWGPRATTDILVAAKPRMARFVRAVEVAAEGVPVAICPPTLPLPPVSYLPGCQSGAFEWRLREYLLGLATLLEGNSNVKLANPEWVDEASPSGERLDVKGELISGCPYRPRHASLLADLLARLVAPRTPKKGLITDLDDTLWRGILGEDGPAGISWHLDRRSHMHGLYQQLLRSLADSGVLLAVASKNDSAQVETAFAREDLVLGKDRVFPMAIHWGRKSESVRHILRVWNVGPDSVVFVDDTLAELAEVKAVYPDAECLHFPARDDQAVYRLLHQLRDMFGKDRIAEEDTLRLESIRRAAALSQEALESGSRPEDSLAHAEAEITVSFATDSPDDRALELVNKTNQFNLNGKRYTESDWHASLRAPDAFLMVVSYKDRYGPLGKVAVVSGRHQGKQSVVETWVMSCRAFARRIEYRCLDLLFETFGADEVLFDFKATPRNRPLCDFLTELTEAPPVPWLRLSRELFRRKCPVLFHRVQVI